YAQAQPKLQAKIDALHAVRERIPVGQEHDFARAVTNYEISQTTRQLEQYYDDTANTIANAGLKQIPVIGTLASTANTIRTTGPALVHTAQKYREGDLGSMRKAASRALLDEAYLNDSPFAQEVMEIYYGKDAAKKIGEQWRAIYEAQL